MMNASEIPITRASLDTPLGALRIKIFAMRHAITPYQNMCQLEESKSVSTIAVDTS